MLSDNLGKPQGALTNPKGDQEPKLSLVDTEPGRTCMKMLSDRQLHQQESQKKVPEARQIRGGQPRTTRQSTKVSRETTRRVLLCHSSRVLLIDTLVCAQGLTALEHSAVRRVLDGYVLS